MRHANSDKLSERALGAMDAAVYAAEEMACLRAINAELVEVLEHLWPWTQREPVTEREWQEYNAAVAEAQSAIAKAKAAP